MIEAKLKNKDTIDVWGDGKQTESFLYIDDCIEGTLKLFNSDFRDPLNIGSDDKVSINQLIEIAENVSNFKVKKNYLLDKPKGVRGRSSNNDKLKEVLKWNYSIKLQEGIKKTYSWIYENMIKNDPESLKFTKSDLKSS